MKASLSTCPSVSYRMELVDIGANLAHDSFDADRDAVLARGREAGVTQLVITGSSLASTRAAIALARAQRGVLFATAGLHPHHASEWTDAVAAEFAELIGAGEVVAAGECGLDYFRDLSP